MEFASQSVLSEISPRIDEETPTTYSVSQLANPPWPEIEPPLDWVEAFRWESGQEDIPYICLLERNAHLAERNRYLRSVGLPKRFFSR